jgi:hypothetical protein
LINHGRPRQPSFRTECALCGCSGTTG